MQMVCRGLNETDPRECGGLLVICLAIMQTAASQACSKIHQLQLTFIDYFAF